MSISGFPLPSKINITKAYGFILILMAFGLISCRQNEQASTNALEGQDLPNIILLMADDLGYGDLASYGNPEVKTPHLDTMAAEALRFSRFYAAAPVCSPTRGSCLTGRHPYRYGIPWAGRHPLPAEEITLAEALKSKGYKSGHFGKWHLGGLSLTVVQSEFPSGPSPYSPPWEHGFDESFSTESMVPTYNPYYHVGGVFGSENYRHVQNVAVKWGQRTDGHIWRDRYWTGPGQMVDQWLDGDDSEIIMDRALDFIKRQSTQADPFLALIWFHAPHSPVVAGGEHRELYSGLSMEEQHWFGSITAMDKQIGRLRSFLKESGISDNTILWFCSDNGPSYIHKHNSAGPLRGKKAELYEGGIRVPAMLEWPAEFPDPGIVDDPVSTSDFYPTLLAIANIKMDKQSALDGEDILPVLQGKAGRKAPIAFLSPLPSRLRKQETTEEEQYALIDRQFKLISMDNGNSFQLYDLQADEGENSDISGEKGEVYSEMKQQLQVWIESLKN